MTGTNQKTGFVRFVVGLDNRLYNHLVTENDLLAYLLSSKLSQNHLELFFAAMRSLGGGNDNPTAKQFAAALKHLTVRNEVKDIDGGH